MQQSNRFQPTSPISKWNSTAILTIVYSSVIKVVEFHSDEILFDWEPSKTEAVWHGKLKNFGSPCKYSDKVHLVIKLYWIQLASLWNFIYVI